MINSVYVHKLIQLVKNNVIAVEDIKVEEYRQVVNDILNPQ